MQDFDSFWPYYLREHTNPLNRRLHLIGTACVLLLSIYTVVTGNLWFLCSVPPVGYGFAWIGHFLIEKNRPATFKYPLWSLRGDFKMFFLAVSGRLPAEVERIIGRKSP